MTNKIINGILGLCVGDAVGVPAEFIDRATLQKNPVNGMIGCGSHDKPPGTWSDDTSMTLCLLDSLSDGLDYGGIMDNFLKWIQTGAYTPEGQAFGLGNITGKALMRYSRGIPPLECGSQNDRANGNGSLMRILPIVFYLHSIYGTKISENEAAMTIIHNVSSLTHAHKRSQIACGIYCSIAGKLLEGKDLPSGVKIGILSAGAYYKNHHEFSDDLVYYKRLTENGFSDTPIDQIKSSGYVVDTLEAAIWCLLNTNTYKDCILKAVNLGEDTDTVAAVAGGLAGLHYGSENIPEEWLSAIVKRDYIESLCNKLDKSLSKR